MISVISPKFGWKVLLFVQISVVCQAVWTAFTTPISVTPNHIILGYILFDYSLFDYISSILLPGALYGLYLYAFNRPIPKFIQSKVLLRAVGIVFLFSNLCIVWESIIERHASQLDGETYTILCVLFSFPSVYALWRLSSTLESTIEEFRLANFIELWGMTTLLFLHLTSFFCLIFVSKLLLMAIPHGVILTNGVLFIGYLACLLYRYFCKNSLSISIRLTDLILVSLLLSKGIGLVFEFSAGGYLIRETLFLCFIYLVPALMLSVRIFLFRRPLFRR
ncbi:hypothetical protein [Marinomonas mediterranea]|jgi:hypothetical protein|uniref:Uncharacterized protein n=1 Tax=Marinomonas mediterranea (strain ATCC 700492 / JCM 21426 / NBRC 103028 / MMB-1) TaxID=717774 RepID=F2JXE9_MARM1|nr:hypothetical protein [Marinomonas mediterranea]ADZ91849.1 hypothetical protein Marme_2617 [Marinomonas mediterranea MMB-1]WCN17941.1 hypothetical protein GV053_13245 [Marinomonas mediterranea MMB-1]